LTYISLTALNLVQEKRYISLTALNLVQEKRYISLTELNLVQEKTLYSSKTYFKYTSYEWTNHCNHSAYAHKRLHNIPRWKHKY